MRIRKESLKSKILAKTLVCWLKSLRVNLDLAPDFEPGVLALWHQDLMACTAAFKGLGVQVLISQSRDGDLLSAVAKKLGYIVFRGSDSKGFTALRHLKRALIGGAFVGMAMDGPKGPALRSKPGTLWLFQNTGAPAWQLRVEYSWFFRLKTWDRFFIPLPFTKIKVSVKPFA
jgi:lysophospholipid acyltransferase (LPLAT)-like uncharacterized protein